ncbi:MAG: cobalt-precorrin-6A reductase [Alphaproteobacteria bacterium]|nr:cobalt-precorrin-6A reductase [Alphaproteobacteria bacterium]
MGRRILILGGTADARELAELLDRETDCEVITSLAGRTSQPAVQTGTVRVGGFGGADPLAGYLAENEINLLIDATHPYAAQISTNATAASEAAGVPSFRLERPGWAPLEADNWINVSTVEEAVAALPNGARALVTVGTGGAAPFLQRLDIQVVARMIERPAEPPMPPHKVMVARPPFALEDELLLMRTEHITHLVTKNAGGKKMAPKIAAARALKIPVVMIARPKLPEIETARNLNHALAIMGRLLA